MFTTPPVTYEAPILGSLGTQNLFGGVGNDQIYAGTGQQTIMGGVGDDTIWGGSGAQLLIGGHGPDMIHAGWGQQTVTGGVDNNMISGGNDNQVLEGGHGDNVLTAGSGNDTLSGGTGKNTLVFSNLSENNVITNLWLGHDIIELSFGSAFPALIHPADLMPDMTADAQGNAVLTAGIGFHLVLQHVSLQQAQAHPAEIFKIVAPK